MFEWQEFRWAKPWTEMLECRSWRNAENYEIAFGLILAFIIAVGGATRAVAETKPNRKPDFGPNVLIFDPAMAQTAMQKQIDKVYAVQRRSEFGPKRYALLFLPGEYHLDIAVGFYTQVLGLGAAPDAVHISGNVHAGASHVNNNATTTFWRAAEGFSVRPAGGTMQWAVSQAVPFDVCMFVAIWCSTSITDGPAADGCQTHARRWQYRFRHSAAMDCAQ